MRACFLPSRTAFNMTTWQNGNELFMLSLQRICRCGHLISRNEWAFLFILTHAVFRVSSGLWRRGVWGRSFPSGCQLSGPISFCSANKEVMFAASWCRVPLLGVQTEIVPAVICEKTLSLHRQFDHVSRAAGKTCCWIHRPVHSLVWLPTASFILQGRTGRYQYGQNLITIYYIFSKMDEKLINTKGLHAFVTGLLCTLQMTVCFLVSVLILF